MTERPRVDPRASFAWILGLCTLALLLAALAALQVGPGEFGFGKALNSSSERITPTPAFR